MFLMKRKTLALFAGGVGALGLLAMAEKYRQSRAEMKKAALIKILDKNYLTWGLSQSFIQIPLIRKIQGLQEVSS